MRKLRRAGKIGEFVSIFVNEKQVSHILSNPSQYTTRTHHPVADDMLLYYFVVPWYLCYHVMQFVINLGSLCCECIRITFECLKLWFLSLNFLFKIVYFI